MNYKMIKIKPETPKIVFKCAYCGKLGVRRASKVKNPNLIFCDNTCSHKYRSKQILQKRAITSSQIKDQYQKWFPLVRQAVAATIIRFGCGHLEDTLYRECQYAIWRCLLNNHKSDLTTNYIKTYLQKYLINTYYHFYYSRHVLTVDMTNLEKNALLTAEDNNIIMWENYYFLNQICKNNRLSIAQKLVIDYELNGLKDDEVIKKYNLKDKRALTYNLSAGRKQLQEKRLRILKED